MRLWVEVTDASERAAAPYLFNNVSDGKQLLCGVSCLRQGGIVIVAGDHRAEPGVVIGTYRNINVQMFWYLIYCEKAFFNPFITVPITKVCASFKHVPEKKDVRIYSTVKTPYILSCKVTNIKKPLKICAREDQLRVALLDRFVANKITMPAKYVMTCETRRTCWRWLPSRAFHVTLCWPCGNLQRRADRPSGPTSRCRTLSWPVAPFKTNHNRALMSDRSLPFCRWQTRGPEGSNRLCRLKASVTLFSASGEKCCQFTCSPLWMLMMLRR